MAKLFTLTEPTNLRVVKSGEDCLEVQTRALSIWFGAAMLAFWLTCTGVAAHNVMALGGSGNGIGMIGFSLVISGICGAFIFLSWTSQCLSLSPTGLVCERRIGPVRLWAQRVSLTEIRDLRLKYFEGGEESGGVYRLQITTGNGTWLFGSEPTEETIESLKRELNRLRRVLTCRR